ncbi:MAG: MFS transporter [Chloroflexi bacterium]|nr:MFS transporter [Chloroflexota bacterium]
MQTDSVEERIKPFASLAYRDFRLLWLGMPFSQAGQWMRNTANAWQVYHITGSSTLLGLTFLFQGMPSIVVGLFGGALADTLDRRRLMLVTQSLQIGLALLLGVLTASGAIQVWHIYAITFASSCLFSVEGPARMALIPRLVPRPLLLNASALQSVGSQASLLLGPLMAGAIIGVSVSYTYFLNAVMIVPAVAVIGMMRVPQAAAAQRARMRLPALFEGVAFVLKTRVLAAFLLLDTVTMVLGYYPAMMPVFAEDILRVGPLGLGALLAAPAFGAIVGFLAILAVGNIQRKGALIAVVTVLHGVVLALFAVSPWFLLSLLLVAMLGLLDSMSMAVRTTSFQMLAPDRVRGRVVSLVQIFAVGSNSLGGAYLGVISSLLGARLALGLGGAIAGSVALAIGVLWREVRAFKA